MDPWATFKAKKGSESAGPVLEQRMLWQPRRPHRVTTEARITALAQRMENVDAPNDRTDKRITQMDAKLDHTHITMDKRFGYVMAAL